jgi:8-oxo-dGTP pyrophosphatase MutT (NUDIX family)
VVTYHEQSGFPIVTADNVDFVLDSLGVHNWPQIAPPMELSAYVASDLTEEQTAELRFAPKVEVLTLQTPRSEVYRGFRTSGKDWSTGLCLLPGNLVPTAVEYKAGADQRTYTLPSGTISKADLETDDPEASCIKREFREETGFAVKQVIPLTGKPLLVAGRNSTLRYRPYLIEVLLPLQVYYQKFDRHEHLQIVLFELEEWLKFCREGSGVEATAVSTTYLALHELNYL